MNLKATYKKHTLQFLRPAGTSRGTYNTKNSWFIILSNGEKQGIGECSILKDLSIDDVPDFETKLDGICSAITDGTFDFDQPLYHFPAIQFGLETALADLKNGGDHIIYSSDFTKGLSGIPTNGLIWMGDKNYMRQQISEKIAQGFSCIKLKIGALNWDDEKTILKEIRKQFSEDELTLRVDANGAYSVDKAMLVLSDLAKLKIHSIEQPIKAGQWDKMAELCAWSPTPIALDEELIGVFPINEKKKLIETIQPQYLILKPGLLGGFAASSEWVQLAEDNNIAWWATSALESNIGLNAISQWVFTYGVTIPQGLGTGMLFSNNIASPLTLKGEGMYYDKASKWDKI